MRLLRFRHSISHKVFRVLAGYSWHILVVAGIGAFALGCVGYWKYLSGQHKGPSLSDVAYASMQLFFGTTMAETHLPTTLNIALRGVLPVALFITAAAPARRRGAI